LCPWHHCFCPVLDSCSLSHSLGLPCLHPFLFMATFLSILDILRISHPETSIPPLLWYCYGNLWNPFLFSPLVVPSPSSVSGLTFSYLL
jgi:hypothetical protein